jgi:N-acetylneuraminic acid mutarotase
MKDPLCPLSVLRGSGPGSVQHRTLLTSPLPLWAALILLACLCLSARAQNNEWTWMGGSSTVPGFLEGQPGVYGALGTPAAANLPGGRIGAVTWKDKSGKFWLFGGNYYDGSGPMGYLNDLWEFDLSTNEWTWMSGSDTVGSDGGQPGVYGTLGNPAAGNTPGGRWDGATWIDKSGNLWLFGGIGYDANDIYGDLNDLWEFSPSTREWAWMGGSRTVPAEYQGRNGVYGTLGKPAKGNSPGGRWGASSWTDGKGNFWLFGGGGFDAFSNNASPLDDLWEFSPSTNEWAWMGGTDEAYMKGTYGTLGKPAAGNVPGGRESASSWVDAKGNFWIFGGRGFDSVTDLNWLNDLWEFQPSIGEWAWMGGSNAHPLGIVHPGPGGVYGALQTPAAGNIPGGRTWASSWSDSKGNFWLFGGEGYDAAGNFYDLNDLWEFQPSTQEWAWMGGTNLATGGMEPPGQYGTLQSASFGDTPGARLNAANWIDGKGNIWVFGGFGLDATGVLGNLNDLWKFELDTGGLPVASRPVFSLTAGTYTTIQTLTISDATPGATIYYTVNGVTPATRYTGKLTLSSPETIDAIAVASGYATSTATGATYNVDLPPAATPTFSVPAGSYATAQTVTISDATPGAVIHYATSGAPTTSSSVYKGPITLSASDTLKAIAVAYDYTPSAVASAEYTIQPTSALGLWTWMGGSNQSPACTPVMTYCGAAGVYGSLGKFAAANAPGGRSAAASWTDRSGNLWLFGGEGVDSTGKADILNDLWEFSPSTGEWAWIGGSNTVDPSLGGLPGVYGKLGVPSTSNIPGSRSGATTWTDSSGNFWLFGGSGFDSQGWPGLLNDLWRFNPSSKEWTWMGGSSVVGAPGCQKTSSCSLPGVYGKLGTPDTANYPGGRANAAVWVDASGNVWIFAGSGFDSAGNSGMLNDLWKFSPATGQWTWMSGGEALRQCITADYYCLVGIYGTLGAAAPGNTPGSHVAGVNWIDANSNLWYFGGWGFGYSTAEGYLNDLWEFTPTTGEWTWMGGNDIGSAGGFYDPVYGLEGTPSPTNMPGARESASFGSYANGSFWFFAGNGISESIGFLNDLWTFDPYLNEWTWMGGSTGADGSGVYGTLKTGAPTNIPMGRAGASSWTDRQGNLWFFGGQTFGSGGEIALLNDLWRYQPLPMAAKPAFGVPAGAYTTKQTVSLADTTSGSSIYYTLDGSTPTNKSARYVSALTIGKTTTVKAIAEAAGLANSGVAAATYIIHWPQSITFTQPANPVTYGIMPITLSAAASSGLALTFSVVSGPAKVSGDTLTITGAGTVVVAANQAGNANYAAAPQVTRSITVNKAKLTATANNLSMKKGATVPALTYSLNGFVNGDMQATATTGKPALSTTATSTSPAGSYPITVTAGNLASTKYSITYVNGKLTVSN